MKYGFRLLAAGVCFALSAPALAQSNQDARVRDVAYEDGQVYQLTMAMRSAGQVVFSEGETIENIAVGDALTWEVAPSGHILFVKPRDRAEPTNMIVTTRNAAGRVRSYHFQVSTNVSSSAEYSGATYAMRFTYPEELRIMEQARAAAMLQAQAMAVEAQAIELSLDAALSGGPRNLQYSLTGPEAIAPSEITDNGIATVLRFPRGRPVPAIFKVLPDGTEAIVNFSVRGEFVIVHEVVSQLRLRMGNSLVCIWNDGPVQNSGDTSSGTVSPDVVREVEVR